MLDTCGDAENKLAMELSQHEVQIEREVIDPLCLLTEVSQLSLRGETHLDWCEQKWFISVLVLKHCFKEPWVSGGKWVWNLQHVLCYNAQFKIQCKPLILISDRDPKHSEAEEAACKAGAGLGFCKGKVGEHFIYWVLFCPCELLGGLSWHLLWSTAMLLSTGNRWKKKTYIVVTPEKDPWLLDPNRIKILEFLHASISLEKYWKLIQFSVHTSV